MTTDQVMREFVGSHVVCQLCGNTGVIDLPRRRKRGYAYGGRHYCVCPNGRKLRVVANRTGKDLRNASKEKT